MNNSLRFNMNIVIKVLLLFGFAAFFMITIFTGSVSLYVHPRIIPYMIFASIAMIIIAFLLLKNLFKSEEESANSWPLLFFVVPLIMAFSLPAKSFDSSTGTTGDVQLSSSYNISNSNVTYTSENPQESELSVDDSESTEPDSGVDTSVSVVPSKSLSLQNGILVMDSSNYYDCLCEIYANLDKYIGTPIEVIGFVFNDNETFADDEFVPARLMMVCCAADMQPVGLLCRYDKASELEADSWVKVNGIIEKVEYDGDTIPCISAQSVDVAKEPDDAYVYPY